MTQVSVLALTAVNLKEKYLSCVPFFIDFWLDISSRSAEINYVPKVLVIASEFPAVLEEYRAWCELFQPEIPLPSTFCSQAVRVLQPSLEGADFVLTTDVDMLPLDDRVFKKALHEISLGADFVVCRDVLPTGQFPICYGFASPETWAKITGIRSSNHANKQLAELFSELSRSDDYLEEHGGFGWYSDQEYLYRVVTQFEHAGGRVARLTDQDTRHKRLDRLYLPFPLSWFILPLVYLGAFSDYHVHHPVERHRTYVSAVKFTVRRFRKRSRNR